MVIDRDLAYIDSSIWYPEQSNEIVLPDRDYAPLTVTEDDITLLISTNRESFKRVLSSILVGADLIYPDISHKVAFDYLREFEYPMSICSLIIECIQNDEDVKAALREFLRDEGVPNNKGGGGGLGQGSGAENILEGIACDLDTLYGACVAIVDYVHDIAAQLIATLISESGDTMRLARLIDFVPILGDLPLIDDINDFLNWILAEAYVKFDAGYSVDLRQDLICYMFERACADCELSAYDITSAYAANGGFPLNPEDAFELLLTQVVGLTAEQAVTCGIMGFIAAALANDSEVLGLVGIHGLGTIAKTGDPDGDWEIFCDPCSETPFALEMEYPSCGVGLYGKGANLTNQGASPLNAAWTRYTFNPTTNPGGYTGEIPGHPSGCVIREIENRSFKLQAAGRSSGSGSVIGKECLAAESYSNITWTFPSTGLDYPMRGFYYGCANNSMTFYIDVEWI